MQTRVVLRPLAQKQLLRVPGHVRDKLEGWVQAVHLQGPEEVRRVPGYHDEPLRGVRKGQRSIRLSKSYRAIYTSENPSMSQGIRVVAIEEVSKHGY